MERDLGQLDDNEYLRHLAQWLKNNEDNFLRYSRTIDADIINYDLLYRELVKFQTELEKF
jgi:hypothetical protein